MRIKYTLRNFRVPAYTLPQQPMEAALAQITNLSEYREERKRSEEFIINTIRNIYRSGWNGRLTVQLLAQHCRNPLKRIPAHDMDVLKIHGLLERDGQICESVKKVILSRLEDAKETFGT